MPHYLLFFPDRPSADPANFAAVGLADLLRPGDDQPKHFDSANGGPLELPGGLWTWTDPNLPGMRTERNPRPGYFPDDQEWTPAPADPSRRLPQGRYWIGREKGKPITPADIARWEAGSTEQGPPFRGRPVPMADGQAWTAPNCLALPHRYALDSDGAEVRRVKEEHAAIYQRATWALAEAEKSLRDGTDMPESECRRYCAEMLGHNYRINWEIAHWLGLFDDECWLPLLLQTIDHEKLNSIREEVKKKALRPTPTS